MKENDDNIEDDNQNKKIDQDYVDKNNQIYPQDTNPNMIKNINISQDKYNLISENTEFDENIYFSNYFSVFRKIEFNEQISQENHPYIMSREILYSYFEDKWQGAGTVRKWRNEILEDWAERWKCLKED